MRQADLFAPQSEEHPYQETADRLRALAKKGIYIGSSSWKYDSWQGAVYVEPYRSKKDFEQSCLEEYARLFTAVGGDFSFYNYPRAEMINKLDEQTPRGFKIGLKCTEFITLKRYPNIARWGENAGKANPDFLNATLFTEQFLKPIEPLRKNDKLAPIIMEFTAFPRGSFRDWTEFATVLEAFFTKLRLQGGDRFEYGVEVRSADYVHDDFYSALRAMGVAPIINSWTRTPPMDEQCRLFEKHDFPFVECRAVMRPGRTRDEAVTLFEPYAKNRETYQPGRTALKTMVNWALANKKPAYIFINNHMEGCAHQTISEFTREFLRDY